jgi:hypothetical protein
VLVMVDQPPPPTLTPSELILLVARMRSNAHLKIRCSLLIHEHRSDVQIELSAT